MLATVVMAWLAVAAAQSDSAVPLSTAPTMADRAKTRLADAYMREAVMMMSPTDIHPTEVEAAIHLSHESATMFPDEPDRWRVVYAISSTAAAMLPMAAEANREAIENLARLCPADEVVRLRRLVAEVERRETAEARVAAYERLTGDDAVKVIGARVASRLAFDQALFESRIGDAAGFASGLERSLVLSPAFPAAAEAAAGFIAERVDDPIAECELLIAAAMANPTEPRLWSRLAALLLQEAAYDAAVRVCQISIDCATGQDAYTETIDIGVSELALALWGAKRDTEAIETIRRRLKVNREAFADIVAALNPGLSRAEAATVPGPISILASMVGCGIASATKASDAKELANGLIMIATERRKQEETLERQRKSRGIATSPDPGANERARVEIIECSIAGALFGADVKSVTDGFAAAAAIRSLDEAQSDQASAWKLLATGEGAAARDAFAKLESSSVAVALGRAKAALLTGDTQRAAREYLAVATGGRGTLYGLFAESSLRDLIARGLAPPESLARLNGLVASIPSTIERYLRRELPALTFTAKPDLRIVGPFEPIWYTLTLKNVSSMTLAVTPQGPIMEHILLQPRLLMPGALVVDRMTPEIIAFDRAIELRPHESMTMRWNFGWTGVGYRTALHPVTGAILELRGAANFSGSVGGFKEGVFGAMPTTANTEVQGVRVTPEWIASATEAAARANSDEDVINMVLLAFAMKDKLVPEEAFEATWKAIAQGWAKLPPAAQEWTVISLPSGVTGITAFLDVVRATENPKVRAAYLLNYCRSADDAQIAAAVRSGSEWAMQAALVVQARFLREAARAEERMRGAKQESVGSTRDAAQQVGKEGASAPPAPK